MNGTSTLAGSITDAKSGGSNRFNGVASTTANFSINRSEAFRFCNTFTNGQGCRKDSLFHKEIPNSLPQIKQFFKELKSVPDFRLDQAPICMEHTGIYSNHLLAFLVKMVANIWVESAIKIKRSIGLVRGKSDKIDAARMV